MRPRHGSATLSEPRKPRTRKRDRDMDKQTKELVAIGASVAANCYPGMKHHLAKCDELRPRSSRRPQFALSECLGGKAHEPARQVRAWRACGIPSDEAEDLRRSHLECDRLARERTAHISRINGLLFGRRVPDRRRIGVPFETRMPELQKNQKTSR